MNLGYVEYVVTYGAKQLNWELKCVTLVLDGGDGGLAFAEQIELEQVIGQSQVVILLTVNNKLGRSRVIAIAKIK